MAKPLKRGPNWSAEDTERLKRFYPVTGNHELGELMGRSSASLVTRAWRMGLKKMPERLQEMGRSNVEKRWGSARPEQPPKSA